VADDAQIANLESLLNSGAKSVSVDGESTTFVGDEEKRRRLAELRARSAGKAWPQAATINLSSGFDE